MNPFDAGIPPIDFSGAEMQVNAMLEFLLQQNSILFNGGKGDTQLWYTPDTATYRSMAFGGLRLYEGRDALQALHYFMLAETAAERHIDPNDHSDRKLHKWMKMLLLLPGVRELNADREALWQSPPI